MKLKTSTLIYVVWFMVVFLISSRNLEEPLFGFENAAYYIFSIVLVVLSLLFSSGKSKTVNSTFSFFCFAYFLYVLVFFLVGLFSDTTSDYVIYNFRENLMFTLCVISIGKYTYEHNHLNDFLKYSFGAYAAIISVCLIKYFPDSTNFANLFSNIFTNHDRIRFSFGFIHANYIGNMCLVCLISSFAVLVLLNIKKTARILILSFDLILIWIMLLSASRASITGLIVFVVIYLYFKNYYLIKSRNIRVLVTVLMCFMFLVLVVFTTTGNFQELLENTNRGILFDTDIPEFFKSGRVLWGFGLIQPARFSYLQGYGFTLIDNYYIYTLMASGIIGSTLILIGIIHIFKRIIGLKDRIFRVLFLSIFITNLYTGLFESCIWIPAYASSLFFAGCILFVLGNSSVQLDRDL